ncbi:hypothetical protein [Veronia pacifica]|uniref:Uncharacterized protein n=2 Tax=Veronia pacifica TaxID=1080227 RepID=A0A1C3EPH7_9GAMM|nr:hypothetical protein [Veronia pacifica]ODA35137.1 hypothetical protein A8L45_05555 [Veronia pacifica]
MTAQTTMLEKIKAKINASDGIDQGKKSQFGKRIDKVTANKLNILCLSQSAGTKKATLSALFPGMPIEAENRNIVPCTMNHLTVWDCPTWQSDEQISTSLLAELGALMDERDENDEPLIDLVLLLADGSKNQSYAGFQMLCDHLISLRDKDAADQMVIGINYADHQQSINDNPLMAAVGSRDASLWPQPVHTIIQKSVALRHGIQSEAVEFEAGESFTTPTNLLDLLRAMFVALPTEKGLVMLNQSVAFPANYWSYNTRLSDHLVAIENAFFDYIWDKSFDGCRLDGKLGAFVGDNGEELGEILQTAVCQYLAVR